MQSVREKPLDLDDFDKTIVTSVRENMADVRSSILNGTETTRAKARLATMAKQPALREGKGSIVSLQAHERADAAILEYEKAQRSHPVRIGALISLWLAGPLLALAIIVLNLTFSKLYLALGMALLAVTGAALILGYRDNAPTFSVLAAVLPTVANTESEKVYGLAAADVYGAQARLGVSDARGMLRSLNSLLDSSRSLALQADAIGKAMGSSRSRCLRKIESDSMSACRRPRTARRAAHQ